MTGGMADFKVFSLGKENQGLRFDLSRLIPAGLVILASVPTSGALADGGLILLADGIEPSMRDIYGAAWLLLVPFFLTLWLLGAEIVARFFSLFSARDKAIISGAAGAGLAIGASYNPSGRPRERGDRASPFLLGAILFGVMMLALFLLSKRFVTYPLAVLLFMASHAAASERAGYEMALESARNDPAMRLPLEEVSLVTSPALVGSSGGSPMRVALRVNNGSAHDLVRVGALCTFYLRNGNVAHQNELTFPIDYRVPSGFGVRVESSGTAPRQFDPADYANRVSCEIRSGHLRTAPSAGDEGGNILTVLSVNENNQTLRVRNDSGRGISSVFLQCLGTAVSGIGNSANSLVIAPKTGCSNKTELDILPFRWQVPFRRSIHGSTK